MGKTTLAVRIAQKLASTARVTVLDQTGEYVGKRHLAAYARTDDTQAGLSVFEPAAGTIAANRALDYLNYLVQLAQSQYLSGTPLKRVIVIDEAHQFVPEPALMGFAAPGRDSAAQFGQLMMQIRKFRNLGCFDIAAHRCCREERTLTVRECLCVQERRSDRARLS